MSTRREIELVQLCYSPSLWNGNDAHLKERFFGLTNPEGNHGEDVKELYYYLDATPTHSYAKALYKYPQNAFPYDDLREQNASRRTRSPEYEITDTGAFDDNQYFDVLIEYAKRDPDETLTRISATNRDSHEAPLHVLPTITFRNEWSWNETDSPKPTISRQGDHLLASHPTLGDFAIEVLAPLKLKHLLFTANETNFHCLNPNNDVDSGFTNFTRRCRWLLRNRPELASYIGLAEVEGGRYQGAQFLALVPRERLLLILRRLLDEAQFFSKYGVRGLSRIHGKTPFTVDFDGGQLSVEYAPGEGTSAIFGGNSNWHGPIWFPVNILLIESLERCGAMYGNNLQVECPVGSGTFLNLHEVAQEIARRLASLFQVDGQGRRPCHDEQEQYRADGPWKDLLLFHEYFHAEDGKGLGASHQTGWTALIATCLRDLNHSVENTAA